MSKSSFSSGGGKWRIPFSLAKHFLVPGWVRFVHFISANIHGHSYVVTPNQNSVKPIKDRNLK